jgi:hypothetical protein
MSSRFFARDRDRVELLHSVHHRSMVILVREEGYHKRIFFSVWASVLTCALLGVLVYNELLLPFSIRQGRDCLTIFFTERCRVVVACAVGDCLCRNVGST